MRFPWAFALISIVVLFLTPLAAIGQEVYMNGPQQAELVEGQSCLVGWSAGGAETVDISVCGTRTPLGRQSRGTYEIILAKGVSAAECEHACTMPWVDSLKCFIKIIGRDGAGKKVGVVQKEYLFRPAIMATRTDDGIYVDLHEKTNQRLYVVNDGTVASAYLCSSSSTYRWLPITVHPTAPHDHAGIFKVLKKIELAHSRQFDVDMPWALRYLSGHFIHATSPNFYKMLGGPASHGCIRLTRDDARALFDAASADMRVEVIGPKG